MEHGITETSEISLLKSPTGIRGFDEITRGGLPRGRPTLLCGGAGSGKTLFSMEFLIHGAVKFDEPGVFIAFEENERELIENTASIGWNLRELIRNQQLLLDYIYIEPSEIEETGEYNLDGLFVRIEHAVKTVKAKRIVLDTIETLFTGFSNPGLLRAELRRLFRWLKERELTAIITGEKGGDGSFTRHGIEEYVSDCVVGLDHRMAQQIAVRRLRVHKYRGSAHGTNEYPFLITERRVLRAAHHGPGHGLPRVHRNGFQPGSANWTTCSAARDFTAAQTR